MDGQTSKDCYYVDFSPGFVEHFSIEFIVPTVSKISNYFVLGDAEPVTYERTQINQDSCNPNKLKFDFSGPQYKQLVFNLWVK